MIKIHIDWSRWSTAPFDDASRTATTWSSNWRHWVSLFAVGHKTRQCSDGMLRATSWAWRFWTLWGGSRSRSGSSSVSSGTVLGTASVRCWTCFLLVQPILVWWIFRLFRFLQLLLQKQVTHVVNNPLLKSLPRNQSVWSPVWILPFPWDP